MKITGNFNTHSMINNHNNAVKQLQNSFTRLSTGKVINTASDNINDFNKTSELDTRIRALNGLAHNLDSELDYVNYKEAAMSNMNNAVQRMHELKIASEDGTNSEDELEAINQEFDQLQYTVKDIYENSTFNTRKVFTNNYDGLNDGFKDQLAHTTNTEQNIEDYSINDIKKLSNMVIAERSRLGAEALGIEAASKLYKSEAINLSSDMSIRMDTDMAKESMNLVKHSLKEQVSLAMLTHAKMSNRNVLQLLK